MGTTDFTNDPEVVQLIGRMKNDKVDQKPFSDLMDGSGNQYIELVQEGGGVLGVALIGYTYVLEQMGLRFFSLAGTSAGSINAMLLAGLGDVSKPKSEKVIEVMINKNLYDFVDGDSDSKDFIKALVEKAKRVKMIWKGWQVIDELFDDLGLNPGDDFLNWLAKFLEDNGVKSVADLNEHFSKLPADLIIRRGIPKTLDGLKPRIAIISADLTTETKVEFPRMANLYWSDPESENPALFVRASMSIPFFFSPLQIDNIPQGIKAQQNWVDTVKFTGALPQTSFFVDGGILSNFPIDVFHKQNSVPRMPTFGIRLGDNRNMANKISNPMNLFGSMFNASRHLHDYDFLLKNPDYSLLIEKIDIGQHDWLNFGITDDAKLDLFKRGALAAERFLRQFDWNNYKEIRKQLINNIDD
ncbi:MAG TPA: patatin-like phospholipase family protein [Prolixibacteraceae bacterium]|nr:patatin-like phospholipase family protein [Prolixibacteraceae bacterium]